MIRASTRSTIPRCGAGVYQIRGSHEAVGSPALIGVIYAHIPTRRRQEKLAEFEVSLYARVPDIRRSRATRRRSRRAANLSTARPAAQTKRSIIINRPSAHSVPATHSLVLLELSRPCHL
jgi:hypothetical protein